ncbi:unnamed protein product [Tuber aestivum]|uniref:Methyltransferase type 11 domain-containing protein n=1 Tax=Tuber aestivum TaxID=59557 RepID=A0A292PKI9_9PEZI|nr:unnamed protein product [Tuber aestivum]
MSICLPISSAQIIGNDLSPIQPSYVPPNLRFEIDDCEEDWPFPDNHFDFIHIRNLVGSVRDWDRIYVQAHRTLKPGGWIELKDHFRPFECDNGSLKPDNVLRTWVDNFEKATIIAGINWGTAAAEFRPSLEKAGFKGVTEHIYKVPLGTWAGDQGDRMREMGTFQKEMLIIGAEGLTLAMFTRVLGWDKKEVDVFVASVREALKDPTICAYTRL